MKQTVLALLSLLLFSTLPVVSAAPDLQVVESSMSAGMSGSVGHVFISGEVQNFGSPDHYGVKVQAIVTDSSGFLASGVTTCTMGTLRRGESCWFGFEFNGLRILMLPVRYSLTTGSDL
jgi:hypothetical protein